MTDHNNYYGVDRALVERSMQKARRDRAQALAALVRRIFNREAVDETSHTATSAAQTCGAPAGTR